jgi:MarR family transcriptional regulator for hemolysin
MQFAAEFNYFDVMASSKKSYSKLLEPICQEWKLTRNELDILLFLANNPEYDRAADIVSLRGIAKSHVSLSVTSLEEKGLLQRRFSEQDRRTAHLELLEQGRIIAGQAREKQLRYFSALYQGISQEEFEVWKNIMRKVRDNIKNLEITDAFL